MKCVVEMYGLALEISGESEIEIELAEDAHLAEVIEALRQRLPELEGKVIQKEKSRLVENCVFNVDGRFYFSDEDTELKGASRIRLLPLATGG